MGKLNKIFSKGHRNPQGLTLFQENIIIETEHGPNGGDEINIIEENNIKGIVIGRTVLCISTVCNGANIM